MNENEKIIRELIQNWAQAVRNKDIPRILAHHSEDIVMYDVPYPFQSIGMDAYRKTWDLFYANTKFGVFDIYNMTVVSGEEVAFCYATMKCADKSGGSDYIDLDFRLTVGLKKIEEQWTVVHEHHSIPSE